MPNDAEAHRFVVMAKFFVTFSMVLIVVPAAAFAKSSGSQSMFRLYNPYSGEHFYTASGDERTDLVKAGWRYEGIGWTAPARSGTPVYRLYNPYAGDHHYTTSAQERDALKRARWRDEGIGWYSDDEKKLPVYRQYNPYARVGTHNFTPAKQEHDNLVRVGWRGEGVAWYALSGRVSESVVGTYRGEVKECNPSINILRTSQENRYTCFGSRGNPATIVIKQYDSETGYISGSVTALCHVHRMIEMDQASTSGDKTLTRDFVGKLDYLSWGRGRRMVIKPFNHTAGAVDLQVMIDMVYDSPGSLDVELCTHCCWRSQYGDYNIDDLYLDKYTLTKVSDAH